ncbi:hypothetical protein ACFT9M_04105 [Micromonospora purpureochromogenes]|uniref:hypothetical protein n=1 Tax=Micromonospora purpureochromogenes TaxID=47872 RepID=UPI00362E2CAE
MPSTTRVTVGATIRVPADGYRFGALWAELRGHEVNPDGTLRIRQRFAFVRLDRAVAVEVPSR